MCLWLITIPGYPQEEQSTEATSVETLAGDSLSIEDKTGTDADETTSNPEEPTEESLEISDSEELASAPVEIEEPALPENIFVNPWLNLSEPLLEKFLAQNWFINKYLLKRRNLFLAISLNGKNSRRSRSETELLLRDPGICSFYSSLILFPRLLHTQIANDIKTVEALCQKLAKHQIKISEALQIIDERLTTAEQMLAENLGYIADFSLILNDFKVIAERKTRISDLHGLIKAQNLNLAKVLFQQSRKFEVILSQHINFLQEARNCANHLESLESSAQTLAGVRLAQILAVLRLSQKNIDDYLNEFIFFATKLKTNLANYLLEAEKLATSIEKNQFHISASLSRFPDRDLHLQKTDIYSFALKFEIIAHLLDQQLEGLRQLEIFEAPQKQLHRTEFFVTIASLQKDFYNFKNFKEMFDFFYNPVEEEKTEDIAAEN